MPKKSENPNEKRLKMVNKSADSLLSKIPDAIDVIAEIMKDPDTNSATRLQACQTLLNAGKEFSKRVFDLEDRQLTKEAAERWEIDLSPLEKLARRMEA